MCRTGTDVDLEHSPIKDNAYVLGARLTDAFTRRGLYLGLRAIVDAEVWDFQPWAGAGRIEGLPRYVFQHFLNRWIANYVSACGPPSGAAAGRFPLADAMIELRDDPSRPEGKLAVMWPRPWLDRGNLTASLRWVITLN